MKRILGALVGVSLAALTLPASAPVVVAQSAPQWYGVTVVQVKPDMLTEYLALQRTETIPALQKAGVRQRDAWQTVFGDGYEYVFVAPINKFADRDNSQSPFVRAMGEQAATNYGARVRKLIAGQQSYAIVLVPDLSIMPAAGTTPKLGIVTFTSVAAGRSTEYESWVKSDLLPVLRKTQETGYVVSRTIFGGDANEYVSLRYVENFAAFDQPPPTMRVLGADGVTKMGAKLAGIVAHTERRVVRYVPDLSFRIKTTSTEP